jgi:hypothetical protein
MNNYSGALPTFSDVALDMNVQAIQDSLDTMPPCSYKEFCEWALSTPRVKFEWLQVVGILGLIRLTESLLAPLLTLEELEQILPYSVPMNISQMYEVISDNLAIGLGARSAYDLTFDKRMRLLQLFNNTAVQCLKGTSVSPAEVLYRALPLMQDISLFEQSLSADKHYAIASAYLDEHPTVDPAGIEYALYPALIANIETTLSLAETIQGYQSESLVREGLIRRYQGVNRLLEGSSLSPKDLIQVGIDTIMVVPTLAYYAAVIAERIHPLPGYQTALRSGTLLSALQDAALLVRLLNDVGTCLLEQSDDDHDMLKHFLWTEQNKAQFATFEDLLIEATHGQPEIFGRLRKDTLFHEFNLCLYEVRKAETVEGAIDTLHHQLVYLSSLYREGQKRLQQTLATLEQQMGSPVISQLIARFVQFHQMLYSQPFSNSAGEYAV